MEPVDLALPSKFTGWRVGQLDAAIAVAASERRFYLLSMPTGGGKSLTYAAIAKLLDARALILTSTKGLQHQLMRDFAEIGLKDIKGQNNYKCIADSASSKFAGAVMVDEGSCHAGVQCSLRANGCTYYDAVRDAASARLVVTNYKYWMTMNKYSDPESLGRFDLLILDEAHDAPDELADFCAVDLDKSDLSSLLGMELPPIEEGQEVWAEWAIGARAECAIRYAAARARLHEGDKYVKLVRRLTDLGRRLAELAKAGSWRRGEPSNPAVAIPGQRIDWVAEYKHDIHRKVSGVTFSPIWAHPYAEDVLFKSVPKVVLVSATLQPVTARYLGITPDQYEFCSTPSTFSAERRPLIHVPTVRVDRNWTHGLQRVWVNKVDAIIEGRKDRKGIIHTRSYDRAALILSGSRNRAIMLTHGSRNSREVVEQFKRSRAPVVLVSPSLETGYDFPYDECEYQIIAKVPFMDTRSAVIQARAKADKKYLNYVTALAIIQQCGRGMRAADDHCETFIIDDNIEWFWPAAKEFFPKWFKEGFRRHNGVPAPPPKLSRKAVVRWGG